MRNPIKRPVVSVLVIILIAILLTTCGGEDTSTTQDGQGATPTSTKTAEYISTSTPGQDGATPAPGKKQDTAAPLPSENAGCEQFDGDEAACLAHSECMWIPDEMLCECIDEGDDEMKDEDDSCECTQFDGEEAACLSHSECIWVPDYQQCECLDDDMQNGDDFDERSQFNGWTDEGLQIANGYYWNPEIVQLDDGSFRMYVEDHGQSIYTNIGIISLKSLDGTNWTYEGIALAGASHPAIVRLPDGHWRLYFQTHEGGPASVGSALSDDGFIFVKESGQRLTSDRETEGAELRHPCVVALPEGGYRMYYDTDAENGAFLRIWSAYSEDGLTFTREGLNIDLTPFRDDWPQNFFAHASKPEVLQTPDGLWRMYFCSSRLKGLVYGPVSIRLATSSDGVNWTVKTENYEITGRSYPDGRVYSAFDCSVQVIEDATGPILRMWYSLFLSPEEGFVGQYSGMYSVSKPLDDLSAQ